MAAVLALGTYSGMRLKPEKEPVKPYLQTDILTNPVYKFKTTEYALMPPSVGGIVMMGDSLTDMGPWSEYFPGSGTINRGISGDTSFGGLGRVPQILAMHPRAVFVMFGTNDLFYGVAVKDVLVNYEKIVDQLAAGDPAIKIYVQSTLSMNPTVGADYRHLKNEDVRALNAGLRTMAAIKHVEFVDVSSELTNSLGLLNETYTTDGIHLRQPAYALWAKLIRAKIVQ